MRGAARAAQRWRRRAGGEARTTSGIARPSRLPRAGVGTTRTPGASACQSEGITTPTSERPRHAAQTPSVAGGGVARRRSGTVETTARTALLAAAMSSSSSGSVCLAKMVVCRLRGVAKAASSRARTGRS